MSVVEELGQMLERDLSLKRAAFHAPSILTVVSMPLARSIAPTLGIR